MATGSQDSAVSTVTRLMAGSVVPKVCLTDPKGSMTSSQGIYGYISVMATLKFIYYFN